MSNDGHERNGLLQDRTDESIASAGSPSCQSVLRRELPAIGYNRNYFKHSDNAATPDSYSRYLRAAPDAHKSFPTLLRDATASTTNTANLHQTRSTSDLRPSQD